MRTMTTTLSSLNWALWHNRVGCAPWPASRRRQPYPHHYLLPLLARARHAGHALREPVLEWLQNELLPTMTTQEWETKDQQQEVVAFLRGQPAAVPAKWLAPQPHEGSLGTFLPPPAPGQTAAHSVMATTTTGMAAGPALSPSSDALAFLLQGGYLQWDQSWVHQLPPVAARGWVSRLAAF